MCYLFGLIVPLIMFSFILSLSRLLNCLMSLENFNVFLILTSLYSQYVNVGYIFISIVIIVTIEITVSLLSLTRLNVCNSRLWTDTL